MAFKMRGFNPGTGTSMGSAFRKTEEKAYGGTRTWKEGEESAGRHGQDLNKLVSERAKHEKGSAEYNIIQNKINQALGSKKRHGGGEDGTAHRITETDKKSKVVHKTDTEKHKTVTKDDKEKQLVKDEKGTKKTVVDLKTGETRGYSTGEYKKEEKAKKKEEKKAKKEQKKKEKEEKKKKKKEEKKKKKEEKNK